MGRFSGFRVTLAQVLKPKVTEDYPKHKRPKPTRLSPPRPASPLPC